MQSHTPHDNLYTRIQPSSNGVGVFAIRDIRKGMVLFAGDSGPTVRMSVEDVARIEDDEIRRMYSDFCPIVDGAFVTPADFNQITMGWYLNHSDTPNVIADDHLRFLTCAPITRGSELTIDYSQYSEHAHTAIDTWKRKTAPV